MKMRRIREFTGNDGWLPAAFTALVTALALGACGGGPAVERDGECDGCGISLEPGPVLSSTAGAIVPTMAPRVARVADRYAVSYAMGGTAQIALFSERGELVGLHHRVGSGPGELEWAPSALLSGADSLIVVDQLRLLIFDPYLKHVRTSQLEAGVGGYPARLRDGRLVSTEGLPSREGNLFRMTLIEPDGRVIRGFDLVPATPRPLPPLVAASSDGGFWSMERTVGDMMYKWGSGGTLVDSLRLDRPWFESNPPEQLQPSIAQQRVKHYNVDFRELRDGRLLVTSLVRDPEWQGDGAVPGGYHDRSAQWDTVIEVIDSRTGAVVAQLRRPEAMTLVRGAVDELFSAERQRMGHVAVRIWRVRY
jgi:hypothetical protein